MADDFDPAAFAAFKAKAVSPAAPADFSQDEFAAFKASQPEAPDVSTAADVAKSGGVGLVKGGLGVAGAAGDARALLSAAADYIGKELGASPEAIQAFKDKAHKVAESTPAGYVFANAPGAGELQKKIESDGGEFHKPQTTAGEYAQTIGEFAPAVVGGEEAFIPRLLSRVLLPGAASETA